MAEFCWLDWNLAKIDNHSLSAAEVEFAWERRTDFASWTDPEPGFESYGRSPCGKWLKIIWRFNGCGDDDLVFVVTAYAVKKVPTG